jgi:hypothetical protein
MNIPSTPNGSPVIPPADPGLAPALARLSADLAGQPVPPLSARARQAARRHAAVAAPSVRPAPAAPRWRAWGFSGAAVCALALLGSVLLVLLPPPAESPLAGRLPGLASGFIAVATAERWEQLLREDATAPAWLVATELPRERLAALGLPFDPARAGDRVSAELLMHPSGEVLAVRVLSH